jgi:hypothetical protein
VVEHLPSKCINPEFKLQYRLSNYTHTHMYIYFCQAWWYRPIIPALGRHRQGDSKFKVSLGYIARPCLQNKKN